MAMLWVGTTSSSLTAITPDPSSLEWGLQDVSASDAGRTHNANATMYKELITSKRKLKLKWLNPTMAQASAIMQAFHAAEYVYVKYWDVLGNALQTRLFYTGDMSAPFRWYGLPGRSDDKRLTELSFDIIER